MHKILITGASGYLGPYLCNELLKKKTSLNAEPDITIIYNSHEIHFDGTSSVKCDLLNLNELTNVFNEINPDTVYHLASGTPTRIIGTDNEYVRKFNKGVTEHLAKLCRDNNALVIYTSTDLVYDEGTDINEDSKLNPLTIYAETKLEGETAIKESGVRHIILRTSLVYGFTQSTYTSFFDTAYQKIYNGEGIKAFTDQYRNPLYVEEAARILAELPLLYKQNEIINFCSDEYLSRYEMCVLMAEVYRFDKKLIIPSSCDEFRTYPVVKRLGLNNNKLSSYGLKTSTFRENLLRAYNYKPKSE